MAEVLGILVFTLLTASFFIVGEIPAVMGSILASGAGERRTVKLLSPIIIAGALVFSVLVSDAPGSFASPLLPEVSLGAMLSAGIAAALAVILSGQFSRFTSPTYAIIGTLVGVKFSLKGISFTATEAGYLFSMAVAPVLCAMLAALIYRISAFISRQAHSHFAREEARILSASTLVAMVLVAAFFLDTAMVFNLLPVKIYGISPVTACAVAAVPLILILILSRKVVSSLWNIADIDLDTDSRTVFSLIAAMTCVFGLFASRLPLRVGLAPAPISAGVLFVSALAGISIVRRRGLVDGADILKCFAASVFTPLMALVSAYLLSRVSGGAVSDIVMLVVALAMAAAVLFYRKGEGEKAVRERIILFREQQSENTRKSISALEVKAEMTEKDLLDKLELRRKELVDFAVGIAGQKKFMEQVYEDLGAARALDCGPERDAAEDKILSSIRERMYFTREMNDFYARSEVLHKDFNVRLKEAYPDLTENERKLANLLRQGFSSKYIASLMNIAPKSVEINRYRLRSKLGLSRSDNLIKFIKSI